VKPGRKRGVLLASFVSGAPPEKIQAEVEFIANNMDLTNNLIFLLHQKDDPSKKMLTYNVTLGDQKDLNPRLFTMRVHRKKQTNTLYTINALNKAVAIEHDGATGKHLKLDWSKYENSIMIVTGGELKTYEVEVSKIFQIEEPE
jgi:hypothetical protein